jgi:hypothetical protein
MVLLRHQRCCFTRTAPGPRLDPGRQSGPDPGRRSGHRRRYYQTNCSCQWVWPVPGQGPTAQTALALWSQWTQAGSLSFLVSYFTKKQLPFFQLDVPSSCSPFLSLLPPSLRLVPPPPATPSPQAPLTAAAAAAWRWRRRASSPAARVALSANGGGGGRQPAAGQPGSLLSCPHTPQRRLLVVE